MLSTAAWNAFLKTLEEPPPHTIFVLATTEAQKVPPTVVDRCHRFDFHRPTVEQIASVVRRAAGAEEIEIPAEARRRARALGDRQLPRRARHARAARHLLRQRDRARRTCSRCSASPTPTCCSAPSTPSPPATRAARCSAPRACAEQGRDAGLVRAATSRRTRASCSSCRRSARCPPSCALTRRGRRGAASTRPSASGRRRRAPAGPARRRDGGGARRRRPAHAAGARAREGRRPEVDPRCSALLARIERLEAARAARRAGAVRRRRRCAAQPRRRPPAAAAGRRAAPRGRRRGGAAPPRAPPRRRRRAGRSAAPAGSSAAAALGRPCRGVVGSAGRGRPRAQTNALWRGVLAEARPVELAGDDLTVAFPPARSS